MKIRSSTFRYAAASILIASVPSSGPAPVEPFDNDHPIAGPEGYIYFRSNRSGTADIYRMAPDGTGQELVIASPGDDYTPRWSPDGALAAYMSDRSGDWEIYRFDASTRQSVRLTNHPGRDWDPSWSPDGNQIAFMRETDADEGNASWQIWAMNPNGTDQRPLVTVETSYWPMWAPDGELLFLSTRSGEPKMYLTASAADSVRMIETGPGENFGAAFSPDGSAIVFGSRRHGNLELYLFDREGANLRRLTDDPARDTYGSWSSNGEWIWFDSDRTGSAEIFRVRPDGTELQQITNQDGPASGSE